MYSSNSYEEARKVSLIRAQTAVMQRIIDEWHRSHGYLHEVFQGSSNTPPEISALWKAYDP